MRAWWAMRYQYIDVVWYLASPDVHVSRILKSPVTVTD